MAKKYELEIPDNMFNLAHPELVKRQGEVGDQWDNALHEIGWLTEIKEPLSFEEWHSMNKPDLDEAGMDCVSTKQVGIIWDAAIENQKLGVVDEEADKKAYENFMDKQDCGCFVTSGLWNAALKYARGLS